MKKTGSVEKNTIKKTGSKADNAQEESIVKEIRKIEDG